MAWGVSLVHGEFERYSCKPFPTALPSYFWQRVLGRFRRVASRLLPRSSGVFEDQSASISGFGFHGFPSRAGGLVPEFGRVGWGFVIVGWYPSTECLPGRFDGLEGLDFLVIQLGNCILRRGWRVLEW